MAQRKSYLLRISPELWEAVNRWAAAEFRSVNGQIEYLLQRAVDERQGTRKDKEGAGAPVTSPSGVPPGERGSDPTPGS